jgi:hypothetical protein
MTRADHIANGPEVATVRRFLDRHEKAVKADEIIAVTDGGTLTARALRTFLAEHDAYRSEASAARAEPPAGAGRAPGGNPPAWAYDLLIAVLNYEEVHGSHRDGWTCFGILVNGMVPPGEIEKARAIDAYWRQKEPS